MRNSQNRALFLDRDGVVNVEKNYLYRIEDFELIAGILDLCTCAQTSGFRIIIITNQAGIARGYYTVEDYEKLTAWMLDLFTRHDIHISQVYFCPYHPTAGIGEYRLDSYDRKPNPGMILKGRDEFCLDLSQSVLVGDKLSDIQAGQAAGVGYNILLSTAKNESDRKDYLCYRSIPEITAWFSSKFSLCG